MHRTRPREVGSRVPRNIVLIVVEGTTEWNYLNGLKERDTNIRIVLIKPGPADPVRLVDACIRNMSERDIDIEEGDLAICVFDVDENPPERIVHAIELAAENNILVSLTNPCFELWLALHFQDVNGPISRKKAYALIRRHYHKYAKTCDLGPVLTRRGEAIKRARSITDHLGTSDPADILRTNPSSNVYLALEAIEALKDSNRDKRSRRK